MSESGDDLREAVERACGCRARARGTVELRVRLHRYALWDGVVHTFELDGHPAASLCYAWVSPAGNGEDLRVRVVPAVALVASAADAVRGAILYGHGGRAGTGAPG